MTTTSTDRLRRFIDQVLESIDDPVDGEALARRVHLSRSHFNRLFAAALWETPAAFRRRLLLERAADTVDRVGGYPPTTVLRPARFASYRAASARSNVSSIAPAMPLGLPLSIASSSANSSACA